MGRPKGAKETPGFAKTYGEAVNATLQRTGEQTMRTVVLVELGLILGTGVTAVIASIVHQRWWTEEAVITASKVLGDAVPSMIGGAAVATIILFWRWRRQVAQARIASWASDQKTISQLRREIGEESGDAEREVREALRRLFDAKRDLEIIRNQASDSFWENLSRRLEEYRSACALLPSIARRFHERSLPALTHFVQERKFDRLSECLNDASDIMLYGEYKLDVTISQPTPITVTNREARRDRFIVLNVTIGNRENRTVSLSPRWHWHIDPGRVHLVYEADAEPLKDYEENRLKIPKPAKPHLAMPLTLPAHGAATGYWCFFIGKDLENNKRLQDGRKRVETTLEIRDLASGQRTKSERFYIEIELISSLLVPLPPADNDFLL